MRQAGEYRIAASRAEVWAALGDLERLKGCLAGCQSLEQTGEGEFMVSLDPAAHETCLLYTSPSPRDQRGSRMPSSA